MPQISLRLLGPPAVLVGGGVVAGLPRKTQALLYLLAISGRSWTRAEVAELLWEDADTGRQSLRVALTKVPKAFSAVLDRNNDRLSLTLPDSDLDHWRQCCQSVRSCLDAAAEPEAPALSSHCEVLAEWPGLLLENFDSGAPQYDDWLYAERQRTQRELEDTVFAAVERLAATGHWEGSVAALQRLLQLNAGNETAHRWLMQCFVASGRLEAARAQYELCKRQLATLLGAAPAAATRAVLQQLNHGASAEQQPNQMPGQEIPAATVTETEAAAPPSWLLGRDREFGELQALLAQQDVRLVSLVAAGGMGKTCMARAVCAIAPALRSTHFVALEGVNDPSQLATTIAATLHLDASGDTPAEERLLRHLAHQPALLVLDNFEQLVVGNGTADGRALVRRLIDNCPQLQILVTTREPLHLHDEWLFDLAGLSLLDAMTLFGLRAKQVRRDFDVAGVAGEIAQICTLVEGMPLAVELAAAATRLAFCDAVLKRLSEGDGPTSSAIDLPPRQKSLDNLIDWSWRLLPEKLQQVLASISVLEGDWSMEEGVAAAGAAATDLAGLCDKSLLIREAASAIGEPRFRLHPLIRRFAANQLANRTDLERQTGIRCAEFYAGELRKLCESFYAGTEPQLTPRLLDLALNARMAVERFLDVGASAWDDLSVTQLMSAWSQWQPFSVQVAWAEDLARRFADAASKRSDAEAAQEVDRFDAIQARLCFVRCEAVAMTGDYVGARTLASEAIARHPRRHEALSECLGLRGLCAKSTEYEEARTDMQAAVAHARQGQHPYFIAQAQLWLLRLLMSRFSLAEAGLALAEVRGVIAGHSDLAQTLTFFEAEWSFMQGDYATLADILETTAPGYTDDVRDKPQALALLAVGLAERGDVGGALLQMETAETLLQDGKDISWQDFIVMFYRGVMHWRLSLRLEHEAIDYQRAEAVTALRRAMAAADTHGFSTTSALIALHLAEVVPASERKAIYQQVLQNAWQHRIRHALPWALLGTALEDAKDGRRPDATLMRILAAYGRAELRGPARHLYDALAAAMPEMFVAEQKLAHTAKSADAAWQALVDWAAEAEAAGAIANAKRT